MAAHRGRVNATACSRRVGRDGNWCVLAPGLKQQQLGRGNHAAALRRTTDYRCGALRAPCPSGHAAVAAGEAQKGVNEHCAELRLACAVRRHVGSPGTLADMRGTETMQRM
jgi:hypothetical protein